MRHMIAAKNYFCLITLQIIGRHMWHQSSAKAVPRKKWGSLYTMLSGNSYQLHQLLQERNQLEKLAVISIHEPALNWDPIGELMTKINK